MTTGSLTGVGACSRTSPPCPTRHHQPELHRRHCLFLPGRSPRVHSSISRETTEQEMAWVPAYSRTGMSRYELYDHRRKTEFRSLGGHFANFSSSVIRISEEIYSRQSVYLSYTVYSRQAVYLSYTWKRLSRLVVTKIPSRP